jgi:hypothetical protein
MNPERFPMEPEPNALSELIRDGNYDFQSGSQHWYTTPATFTIPPLV